MKTMMRSANRTLALILAALPIASLTCNSSGQAPGAESPAASAVDRTVLPTPDAAFQGKIEMAIKDSKAAFPEPLEAPEGRAQRAAHHGRRHRLRPHERVRRAGEYADVRPAGEARAASSPTSTPRRSARRRAPALITGRNAHSVGMGIPPEGSIGFPGYNAHHPAQRRDRVRDPASRTATAPPGSARPTSRPCTRSRPRDRSTAGRPAWAPSISTASSAPA